ncbi:MAG: endolytic transglycosylase MltG, partial [Angelakisella sp.]
RLEGYLFPDTYQFFQNMDPVSALNKMLLRFDEVMTPDLRQEIADSNQTIGQIITIASLIEKETTGDDQTHIASVIYNRLNKPNSETAGFLNIDATIQYVLPQRKGELTAADLEVDSPYNTKNNKGLPPGPIANPGQAAIRAAMHPDSTKDYFYALGDDKAHHFFRTYQQQKDFKATQELYKNAR